MRELLAQVKDTCDEVGAALIGGHTEVTPGLPHTMIVGTMLGRVEGRVLTTGGLRDGNAVGMTRHAGLEGTSILLAQHGDRFREIHGPLFPTPGVDLVTGTWLLVAPEALRAATIGGVTALHDVTEGGVGEALHEMAVASQLHIEVDRQAIPILQVTSSICADLGLDPLGLIGSGSILVGCEPPQMEKVEKAFEDLDVPFTWIGRASRGEPRTTNLPRFPRDELLKATVMDGLEAVVFDMDGTLVNSSYDWPAIRRQLGVAGGSIIDDLNGLPEPDRSRRWAELEAIEENATAEAVAFSGVQDLLFLLRDHGLKTALVTNNSDSNTFQLLDRLELEFDVVLTRDSGFWKPSGKPIQEAVKRLGVTPDLCLGVGDSRYDILAARAARLAAVCVLNDSDGQHRDDADLHFPGHPDVREVPEDRSTLTAVQAEVRCRMSTIPQFHHPDVKHPISNIQYRIRRGRAEIKDYSAVGDAKAARSCPSLS